MRRVAFAKYEGLGNDFVVIEGAEGAISAAEARALCDRHFGIGGDGVLLVAPGRSAGAHASMIVLNADGSRPEMCGNGLRCVALHVASTVRSAAASLVVDTDAGPRTCRVDGGTVEIDMGVVKDEGPIGLEAAGEALAFARISVGNPHAITFEPRSPADIDRLGPAVERAREFPAGTNVEFATLAPDGGIDLVVWERGVGRTLACGTGAVATAASACLRGARSFGSPIEVRLPGGPLSIVVERATMRATMRGPARRVFAGEVVLA